MRSNSHKLLLSLAALSWPWVSCLALGASPTTQPATWVTHDINVDLQSLPQRYYCDEIQQKLRDVLLALGARSNLTVAASRCEIGSRSPTVRVRFSLPEPPGRDSQGAMVIQTTAALVRIEAGHPASLQAGDCELMRQIREKMLAPVLHNAMNFNLNCSAPSVRGVHFNLSAQTLQPLNNGALMAAEAMPSFKQLN
jgi:hypothetical protein